jgi:DNA-binding response OmpR family regulator
MELVKEIRETWPESNVKIVAVTADAFEDTRNLCLAAGFDGWLAKPFRIQDLARVMDLVLANRSPLKSPGSQTL